MAPSSPNRLTTTRTLIYLEPSAQGQVVLVPSMTQTSIGHCAHIKTKQQCHGAVRRVSLLPKAVAERYTAGPAAVICWLTFEKICMLCHHPMLLDGQHHN
jgi:hypothetical protein